MLQEYPKCLVTIGVSLEHPYLSKNVVFTFWATLEKLGYLFIPVSGHTAPQTLFCTVHFNSTTIKLLSPASNF